jgi:hypothetical protein
MTSIILRFYAHVQNTHQRKSIYILKYTKSSSNHSLCYVYGVRNNDFQKRRLEKIQV